MKRKSRASSGKSRNHRSREKSRRKASSGATRRAKRTAVKKKTRKPTAKKKVKKAALKKKKTGKPAAKKDRGKSSPRPARKASRAGTSRSSKSGPAGRASKGGDSPRQTKPKGLKAGSDSRAEQLRNMLESKRTEILEEVRRARQDSMETDRVSFPEVGDLVSASVEKERAFEYGEIGVNALREIDDALEKLKEGTFGICEVCNKPIGLRRLKVMPSARLCIECKSKEEASGR